MAGNISGRAKILCGPGRNETFEDAFGGLTWKRDVEIGSIELTGQFAGKMFSQQEYMFTKVIRRNYWFEDSLLLGRSFGAWIILNALMKLDTDYPGTVILISSVLGYGGKHGIGFIAPRAGRFWEEAESRLKPPARKMALIHSVTDEQCPVDYARKLGSLWRMKLFEFDNGGHVLGKESLQKDVSEKIHEIWQPKG